MTADLSVGVLIETLDGNPRDIGYELLSAAQNVADQSGSKIVAIVIGDVDSGVLENLIARGADTVYHVPGQSLTAYRPEHWLSVITHVMQDIPMSVLLLGHGNVGHDLAPRIAFRVGGSIATGCEDLAVDNGAILATRACYGSKARQVLRLKAAPAVVTVSAKVFEPLEADAARTGEVTELEIDLPVEERIRIISDEKEKAEGLQLEKAKVVVAGGRGVGGPDGFKSLEQLANELGGAVGASRVACDLGWCPHSWQIGLTGKTVSPDLYIAVGISGASQHMAGCGRAKTIVAINNDKDAAIFEAAKFGVVGEFDDIIPPLIQELKRTKEEAA